MSDLCRNLASFIILVRLILCYEVIVHFLFYCSAALSLTLNMVFKCFLRIVFSFLTCFSVEHLSGMNWFKNSIILVNMKLIFSMGEMVLLSFQTAANWEVKKCRYCCGEYVFHTSPLYYLVRFKWNFFSLSYLKSFSVCNSEFLVQGLELECVAVFENWAFCISSDTFRSALCCIS